MRHKLLTIILLLLVGLTIVLLFLSVPHVHSQTVVTIGRATVNARVVASDEDRVRGLSDTNQLGSNQGMLFVFDRSAQWEMWMKDMRYSLDILWLDPQKRVVTIAPNLSPSTYPQRFAPRANALYVIELPAGFAAQNHIVPGMSAEFSL